MKMTLVDVKWQKASSSCLSKIQASGPDHQLALEEARLDIGLW